MSLTTFLLGSDPEVMLTDLKGNLKSAIPVIDGTKRHPIKLKEGMLQHDNVNLEFGIDQADTEKDWVGRHDYVLKQIANILENKYRMVARASADFPDAELDNEEARTFACDPDFDPYEMSVNFISADAREGTLRTCGGHIHIGNESIAADFDLQNETVKALDIFLGIPSLLIDKDPTSQRRRQLYGKAGAHRPKPYGVEYRAIGNFWVSSPTLTRLVYRLVRDCLCAVENGHTNGIDKDAIRRIINSGNLDDAADTIQGIVIPLLKDDSRALLAQALDMPLVDIYDGWQL